MTAETRRLRQTKTASMPSDRAVYKDPDEGGWRRTDRGADVDHSTRPPTAVRRARQPGCP